MIHFSLSGFLDELQQQGLILGIFLTGIGLMFMMLGYRLFPTLIAVSFGVVGFVVGFTYSEGLDDIMRVVVGLASGAALGGLSALSLKVSVAVLAGGWAGLLTLCILGNTTFAPEVVLALGGAVGLAVLALTFVVYHEMIAFTTSFEGALMVLSGLAVFVSHSTVAWYHFRSIFMAHPLFPAFLVLAGTLTGFYLQLAELRRKDTGMTS